MFSLFFNSIEKRSTCLRHGGGSDESPGAEERPPEALVRAVGARVTRGGKGRSSFAVLKEEAGGAESGAVSAAG